ncbi:efflux RND transporter periplasmic adaptor subunit [Sinorhizobium arboris]|uniref:efflux RND transporter periplasmic adaptor subunit n=1 Tax=Sinorhizobium arboris TaxID=76745 RepID=UPI00124328A6|nr:efflux RND transporter periplasmic adaptor subunit [Sinorhizobium arboris]
MEIAELASLVAGDAANAAASDRVAPTGGHAFRVTPVTHRPIVESVQATGSLAPVALVSVSSQVSGQIKQIYADFNGEVRRGDAIALIDPLSFEIAAEQAEAQVGIARAGLRKAEVALQDAEADLVRKQALASRGTGSKLEEVKSRATRDLASAEVENARHALLAAAAMLKQARADLERTVIRSPVDGTIIQRSIEVGQTVAVSLQAPVLFSIAQNLREMQVNASIPEAEIGRIRVGQRLEFTVDSYSGHLFHGEVVQIRKQPQVTQNVVTYTVVASAPNVDLRLLPGMTATARIVVEEGGSTLAVPTAALRFRPPGEPRSLESRVFVEREGHAVAVPVRPGATDGKFTAILSDALMEGDMVITGLASGRERDLKSARGRLVGAL